MKRTLIDYRNNFAARLNRPAESCAETSVISNDCWAGALYQDYGWKYRTPFVGLAVMAPCYLELLGNLKPHLESKLRFKDFSKYPVMNDMHELPRNRFPIGVLGEDIEIHFLHYKSEAEAAEKWSRRVERINWNNIAVKFSADKDYCTDALLREYDQLNYPVKIAFSKNPHPELHSVVQVKNYIVDGAMLFRRSICWFDLPAWLETGTIRKTPRSVLNQALYSFGA